MIKEFEGLKKRNFCKETKKKFYKHGEQTTCVIAVDIPMSFDILGKLWPVLKRKFPTVRIVSTGLFFTVTGTCHPSGGDSYDEKKGKTIAYSKCQKKAYSLTARVLNRISNELAKLSANYEKAAAFMMMASDRENNFLNSL